MSSLLEQAIIDAKMLKETARKNAEAQILDKYSKEIKQSLEMLLEQEDAPAEAPPAEETEAVTETPDLGGEAISEESKSVMDKIPPAYLGENNMEEIELDLDTLVEKVDSMKKELNIRSAAESWRRTPRRTRSHAFLRTRSQWTRALSALRMAVCISLMVTWMAIMLPKPNIVASL